MSDGIERLCNEHPNLGPLREIGNSYACAAGHACPVEWHVKTTGLPYSSPFARRCPFTGTRLIGAGEILQCPGSGAHEAHDVSTRLSDRPAAVIRMPDIRPGVRVQSPVKLSAKPVPGAVIETALQAPKEEPEMKSAKKTPPEPREAKQRRKPVHGSITMYVNYGCRCAKCSRCYAEYYAARKATKADGADGRVKPSKRGAAKVINAAAAIATVQQIEKHLALRRTASAVVVDATPGKLLTRIQSLREDLAAAERDFAAYANGLLTCYTVAPIDGPAKSVTA